MNRLLIGMMAAGAVGMSLGCGLGERAGVESRVELPTPSPASEEPSTEDGTEAPQLATRLPAGRYDDAWLVITQSTPSVEPIAPDLLALAETDPELIAPDQLHSGQFKGLMPCWVTTIAGASEDRAAAVEILERVKAAGIDAYLKNAGEYVGPSDAIDAACAELRSGPEECIDGVRMARVVDGTWQVQLSLPDEVAAAALAGAPSPSRAGEEQGVWTAPLVVQTLGDLAVGDALTVHAFAGGAPQTCSVTGFASTVLGTPHFGMLDSPRPSCGEAAPFAVLDCAAEAGQSGLAAAPDVPVSTWTPGETLAGESEADVIADAKASAGVAGVYERAVADAAERGLDLQQRVSMTPMGGGSERAVVVDFTWFTGEGRNDCGMDDVVHRVAVPMSEDGRVLGEATDSSFAQIIGLVQLPGQRGATVVVDRWFSGPQVGETCGLDVAYCDCAC